VFIVQAEKSGSGASSGITRVKHACRVFFHYLMTDEILRKSCIRHFATIAIVSVVDTMYRV
jgi:hypothetical protein